MPPADEGGHKNFAKIVVFAKAWAKAIVLAKALTSVLAKAIASLAGMSKPFRPLF